MKNSGNYVLYDYYDHSIFGVDFESLRCTSKISTIHKVIKRMWAFNGQYEAFIMKVMNEQHGPLQEARNIHSTKGHLSIVTNFNALDRTFSSSFSYISVSYFTFSGAPTELPFYIVDSMPLSCCHRTTTSSDHTVLKLFSFSQVR